MLAYDAPLDADTRVGLGTGYARSSIDGKTYDASTDFNTYKTTTAYNRACARPVVRLRRCVIRLE